MTQEKYSKFADQYCDWPTEKSKEIKRNWNNREVGSELVSSHGPRKVWHLRLKPGERMPFHRHDCDYFWTVLTDGQSRSYKHDGLVNEVNYSSGDTKHFTIDKGEYFIHDLENIGETELVFVTVEFLRNDG